MKAKKTTNMRESTVFRELDELMAGVHGELTDGEIMGRVAALVAGDPVATAWLVHHARWHRERTGMRFVGGAITQAEASARGMRPSRCIEVYRARNMDAWLVVQVDGTESRRENSGSSVSSSM
jgi:hypothetical protein